MPLGQLKLLLGEMTISQCQCQDEMKAVKCHALCLALMLPEQLDHWLFHLLADQMLLNISCGPSTLPGTRAIEANKMHYFKVLTQHSFICVPNMHCVSVVRSRSSSVRYPWTGQYVGEGIMFSLKGLLQNVLSLCREEPWLL